MDEPTSHLDPPALEQLEKSLQSYPGTFVVVSHDRYFLNGLANRVILLQDGAASFYAGGFRAYLQARDEFSARMKTGAGRKKSGAAWPGWNRRSDNGGSGSW